MNTGFYRNIRGELYCDNIKIQDLAQQYGTPLYVYNANIIQNNLTLFKTAFKEIDHLICYSVKSCSNISICRLLNASGSGFDIVSGGELERVRHAGVDPQKIVFAGVGKTRQEIAAAIDFGILAFTVESFPELELIAKVAQEKSKKAPIAIRVNPDVDPKTHKYISTGKAENKFGMDLDVAYQAYEMARKNSWVEIVGVQMHIGSQLTQVDPYRQAILHIKPFIEHLRKSGIQLQFLDIGGGLGIVYDDENPEGPAQLAKIVIPHVKELGLKLLLEPGRFLVGNAGVLVTEVLYIKRGPIKTFVIVDAAMNDLVRPCLYDAYHRIEPVGNMEHREKARFDVVGPVCESGDFFAKDRILPTTSAGEHLVIFSAGAYGFSMASNYNTRPRAAELLVQDGKVQLIRKRETVQALLESEL